MENVILSAETRRAGRHQVRELRDTNQVPAVLYGQGIEPQPIAVDAKALHKALRAAGSGLLPLQVSDQPVVQVLVREVQRNPIKHHVLHVDFQAVSMTKTLRLEIPIVYEGTAPVEHLHPNAVIVRHLDAVEIECLPTDIPNHLVADLSKLATEDDVVMVKDLFVPAGVEILADPDQVVVGVSLARLEAEEEEIAEEPEAAEVEVVTKGKPKAEAEEEK